MPESDTDKSLKAFLKDLSTAAAGTSPTPENVQLLATALAPDAPHDTHSLGLLSLSKAVDVLDRAGGTADDKAARVKSSFDPLVADALSNASPEPESLVPATSLLASLASLAPAGVVALLSQSLGAATDSATASSVDPLAILLEFGELPSPLQPVLASLLGALAGTKAGRELVRNRALEWVTAASDSKDVQGDTAVLCTVALSKLGREDPVVGEAENARAERDEVSAAEEDKLARALAAHIVSSPQANIKALLPTLEGLSVLSSRPVIRDVLADDASFLKALLALSPVPRAVGGSLPVTPRASMTSLDEMALAPVDAAACFGLTTILANLAARKVVLNEHDAQMARLRRMAIAGKTATDEEDPHESDDAVRARVRKLIAAGVVPALRGLARAESLRVKESLGRLCLSLIEERSDRSIFIRDGGFKVLSGVVRDLTSKVKTSKDQTPEDMLTAALPACQALAKLVITTAPHLLFPPPHQTNALNALSPLYLLLLHPESSLLQQFEALMSLTNLASIGPGFGDRIMAATFTPPRPVGDGEEFRGAGRGPTDEKRVISKVEELLLDDNTLVRRAATELVCNLVSSEGGWMYFSGEEGSTEGKPAPRSAARLGVLLLLCDVEDRATRLAASGALAVLTDSEVACAALLAGAGIARVDASTPSTRSVWSRVADLFEPAGERPLTGDDGERLETVSNARPDSELAHRGAVIASNLLRYADSLAPEERGAEQGRVKSSGLDKSLERAERACMPQAGGGAGDVGVLQAIGEAVKALTDLEA